MYMDAKGLFPKDPVVSFEKGISMDLPDPILWPGHGIETINPILL